jgi:hypothetical protein
MFIKSRKLYQEVCRDVPVFVLMSWVLLIGINKPLLWAAEDLRIHRVHLFITQEEMNR